MSGGRRCRARRRPIRIDGQTLKLTAAGPQITLARKDLAWSVVTDGRELGLQTHALQGPIDAFLDPFLLVRPTGKP